MARYLRPITTLLALVLSAGMAAPGWALDEPDDLMPCKLAVIRNFGLSGTAAKAKIVCKSPSSQMVFDMPNEPDNDPLTEGGTLRLFDTLGDAGDNTYNLPSGNWIRSPSNTAIPARTFKYRGDRSPTDPCKFVIVKPRIVKALCVRQGMTLQPPFTGDLAVRLTIGTNSKRYCGQLGGTLLKNTPSRLKRKDALAPPNCASPSGAFLETSPSVID